jgi:hypothetical protein
MPTQSLLAYTDGAGKNIDAQERTISAVAYQQQTFLLGPPYLPAYSVIASSISTATAASHILEIMAGATNYVAIERVRVKQVTIGTAGILSLAVLRLTSAGTGGGVVTPRPFDSADSAADATAMTLPTVKGAEGVQLDQIDFPLIVARSASVEPEYVWTPPVGMKPWIIPTGATNGLCFKAVAGIATDTISIVVTFSLRAYL